MADPRADSENTLAAIVDGLTRLLETDAGSEVDSWIEAQGAHADDLRRLLPSLRILVSLSAREPRPAALHGMSLSSYRILREIGRGGTSIVYAAEDRALGRTVALKVLPLAASLHEREVARFQSGAQAAAKLSHPNIVPVLSFGSHEGLHFYAMPLIAGEDLARVLARLRLHGAPGEDSGGELPGPPIRELERWAAETTLEVALALEHAHSRGVIHRDVKPANILLGADGHVWVTDFGLARHEADAGLTGSRDFLGTLRYMSPEQARSSWREVGPRSDVYSLGATLYELLTLRPPFTEENGVDLFQSILLGEAASPRRLRPGLSPDLETIVLKTLRKAPEARYPGARELAEDLRRFLRDEPILARRTTLLERARSWSRRHRRPLAAAGITVLAALPLVFGMLLGLNGALRARGDALLERTVDLERLRFSTDMILAQQAALSGEVDRARQIVRRHAAAPPDGVAGRGFDFLHLWEGLHLSAGELDLPGAPCHEVAFLRDGASVAALASSEGSGRSTVGIWSIAGARLRAGWPRTFEVEAGDITASGDGRFLVLASRIVPDMGLVDLHTGELEVVEVGASYSQQLASSPDGRLVAIGGPLVFLWSVAERRILGHWTVQSHGPVGCLDFSPDGTHVLTLGKPDVLRLWRLPGPEAYKPRGSNAWTKWRLRPLAEEALEPRPVAAVFAGDRIVTAEAGGMLVIRDPATLAERGRSEACRGSITALAACAARSLLATGGADGSVMLWSLEPLAPLWTFPGHSQRVQAVAFSPRGDVLASTALGEPARLWPVDDRRRAEILVETEDCLHDVKLSGQGSILTVTGDLRFDRWDAVRARSTGEMGRVSATQETAWSVPGVASDRCVLTDDGGLAAVSTPEAAVRMVHAAPLAASSGEEPPALLPELPCPVYGMGFSRDGRLFAALGRRLDSPLMASLVRVWRRESGGWAQALEIESMAAGRNIVVAPERGVLVFGGRYGSGVEVRSLGDGSLIASFRPHATMVTELSLSPDADLLATAGEDGVLKLWRLPVGPGARPEQAASVRCHPSRINAVVFLPGGRQLLTAPGEGRIRLWHLFEHGAEIRALESLELDHPPGVRDLAVSEDGSTVAACGGASGGRGWLKLWWAADPAGIARRDGR